MARKKKKNAPTPEPVKKDWTEEIKEKIDEACNDDETMDRDEREGFLNDIINHCTVKLDGMEDDDILEDDDFDEDDYFNDLDDDLDD